MDNLQLILEKMTQKRQENNGYRMERQQQLQDKQTKNNYRISQVVSCRGLLMHQNKNRTATHEEATLYSKMRHSHKRVSSKVLSALVLFMNVAAMHRLAAQSIQKKQQNLYRRSWAKKIQHAYRFYVIDRILRTNT